MNILHVNFRQIYIIIYFRRSIKNLSFCRIHFNCIIFFYFQQTYFWEDICGNECNLNRFCTVYFTMPFISFELDDEVEISMMMDLLISKLSHIYIKIMKSSTDPCISRISDSWVIVAVYEFYD